MKYTSLYSLNDILRNVIVGKFLIFLSSFGDGIRYFYTFVVVAIFEYTYVAVGTWRYLGFLLGGCKSFAPLRILFCMLINNS